MFLQQLESVSPNPGSVNPLILNVNLDRVSVALRAELGGTDFHSPRLPRKGRSVPSLFPHACIGDTVAQRQLGARSSPLWSSRGSCHLATTY